MSPKADLDCREIEQTDKDDTEEWFRVLKLLNVEATKLGVDFEVLVNRMIEHLTIARAAHPDDKQKYLETAAIALYEEFREGMRYEQK